MREQEVGVFDFVLLDEITMEKFMQNLKKRWVWVCEVNFITSNQSLDCFSLLIVSRHLIFGSGDVEIERGNLCYFMFPTIEALRCLEANTLLSAMYLTQLKSANKYRIVIQSMPY